MFEDMANRVGLESQYLHMVIKIIGVAYLSQFASELCRDAGEGSMASKIELAGKVMILTLSMPVIYRLLDLVSDIINFLLFHESFNSFYCFYCCRKCNFFK